MNSETAYIFSFARNEQRYISQRSKFKGGGRGPKRKRSGGAPFSTHVIARDSDGSDGSDSHSVIGPRPSLLCELPAVMGPHLLFFSLLSITLYIFNPVNFVFVLAVFSPVAFFALFVC